MMEVRFFDEALEEVEHERSWYAQRSNASEAAFLRELDHAIESIVEKPDRWPLRAARVRRYVFPTFPFSIIYMIDAGILFVVALEHQSRRPGYWRNRLK